MMQNKHGKFKMWYGRDVKDEWGTESEVCDKDDGEQCVSEEKGVTQILNDHIEEDTIVNERKRKKINEERGGGR